jgi:hypothetical protein
MRQHAAKILKPKDIRMVMTTTLTANYAPAIASSGDDVLK